MLGQLSGEEEADGGLDLARGDSGPLVVARETAGLGGNSLEDIDNEGVHDVHALLGDTSVGVNLLQDTVDVGGVGGVVSLLLLLRLPLSGGDFLHLLVLLGGGGSSGGSGCSGSSGGRARGGLLSSNGGFLGGHCSCLFQRGSDRMYQSGLHHNG